MNAKSLDRQTIERSDCCTAGTRESEPWLPPTPQSPDVIRPVLLTSLPGPKAAAWIARDDQVLSPSYTRDYPLVAARGAGCTIEDVDGNVFLDFTAGIAVTATGHRHPEVVAAIVDQATQADPHVGDRLLLHSRDRIGRALGPAAPGADPKRVFFTNSGAESIEAALKLARFHTGRQRVISCYGAFHGRTYGAMSLGGSKAIHQRGFGPLLPGVHRIPFNCDEALIEEQFHTVCPPDEVAAIFVEPIQGEGGYRVPEPRFPAHAAARLRSSTASCWWPTKCSRAWAARARCSPCEHFGVDARHGLPGQGDRQRHAAGGDRGAAPN